MLIFKKMFGNFIVIIFFNLKNNRKNIKRQLLFFLCRTFQSTRKFHYYIIIIRYIFSLNLNIFLIYGKCFLSLKFFVMLIHFFSHYPLILKITKRQKALVKTKKVELRLSRPFEGYIMGYICVRRKGVKPSI